MEPIDDKTKHWIAERRRAEQAKRAELFARKLAAARRFRASGPPPRPVVEQNFVSIYVGPEMAPGANLVIVEGVVFDVYGVISGGMDGSNDFTGFDLITTQDEVSTWRQHCPQIERGSTLRIKFIDLQNCGAAGDHMDDPVLEIWIDQPAPASSVSGLTGPAAS